MKAAPLKIVQGEYVACRPDEATHLKLKTPGPFEYRILPVTLDGSRLQSPCWSWNGDMEKPTLSPSVRVSDGENMCHSWVNDGKIQFLMDCSHKLVGQTLDLLEMKNG